MRTYLGEIKEVTDSGIEEIEGRTVLFEKNHDNFYLRIKGTKNGIVVSMGENDSSHWYDEHGIALRSNISGILEGIYDDAQDSTPEIHIRARGKKKVGGYVKKDRRRAA